MDPRVSLKKNVSVVTLQSLVGRIMEEKMPDIASGEIGRSKKAAEVGTWQVTLAFFIKSNEFVK